MTGSVAHEHGQHAWHQHTAEEYRQHQRPIDDESGPLPVRIGHPAQMSDGFHTMEELYDHRRALAAVLAAYAATQEGAAWRSKAHHPDDTPMFEGGYFIVGIELNTGTVSYHYKLSHWDDFAAVPEVEHAPRWDGHTPATVVDRLMTVAKGFTKHVPVEPWSGLAYDMWQLIRQSEAVEGQQDWEQEKRQIAARLAAVLAPAVEP
jgi:hypothetical protein